MLNTIKVKKEFQKIVSHIRCAYNANNKLTSEYPKAMMTGQQALKATATVNCGNSRHLAEAVLIHPAMAAFLLANKATAAVETVNIFTYRVQYQVRINFPVYTVVGIDLAAGTDSTGGIKE